MAHNYHLSAPKRITELGQRYQGLLYRHNLPGRYQEIETGTYFFAVLRGINGIGQLRLELVEGERVFSLREVRFV